MTPKMAQDNIPIYLTSPNQKAIVTHKAESDKENLYGIFNIEATSAAARNLSDRAFKLWTRMNLHQDGYRYGLSPAEIEKFFGMTDKRYRSAVNELIGKGYLVKSEQQKNLFHFYENPFEQITLPKTTDATPRISTSSRYSAKAAGSLDTMTQQNGMNNLTDSGREIVQNNTTDNTFASTTEATKSIAHHSTPVTQKYDVPGAMFSAEDIYDLFMQDHSLSSGDKNNYNSSFSYNGSDNDLPF